MLTQCLHISVDEDTAGPGRHASRVRPSDCWRRKWGHVQGNSTLNLATCCRTWAARVERAAEELLAPVLGPDLAPYAAELAPYLPGSLGNAQRNDNGTGHETAFAALLFCLARAGAVRFAQMLGQLLGC